MTAIDKVDVVRQAAARSFQSAASTVRKASSDGSLDAIIDTAAAIARRAAHEAHLDDKHGDVSRLRVARAAFRPTRTARRLGVGALKAAAAHALVYGHAELRRRRTRRIPAPR